MNSMENELIRRQVPESAPVYKAEREDAKKSHNSDIFGERGLVFYDQRTKMYENIIRQNADLKAELETIENTNSAQVQRLSDAIQDNSSRAEKIMSERAKPLRKSFLNLAKDFTKLQNQVGYENRKKYVSDEVLKMFDTPEIQAELKNHFGTDLAKFSANELYIKVLNGSISDELLCAAAKHHVENIRQQESELQKIIEETKTEFTTAVTNAVTADVLPGEALSALQRIDSVKVTLSDLLVAPSSTSMGSIDAYGNVYVSNEQLQMHKISRLKKTIFHELLHEISGKSLTINTKNLAGAHQTHRIFERKLGVALHAPYLWYAPNQWLNEAITEWLALKLSHYAGDIDEYDYQGSSSYPTERQELDNLFAAGLEESVVTNAYFENITADQPKGEKGQHFAKLVQRINAIKGPAGFARLENQHIMNEIEYLLYDCYEQSVDNVNVRKQTLPPDAKIFNITISIGASEQAKITKELVYVAYPITDKDFTFSIADQWKRVESTLAYVKNTYHGKVKISVDE